MSDDSLLRTIYGGCGEGKSIAILIAALQYVDFPGYRAIIFKDNQNKLLMGGSIVEQSKTMLFGVEDIKWNQCNLKWTFPNGSTIEFGHVSNDDYIKYAGSEFQYMAFDYNVSQDSKHIKYLTTKLRGTIYSSTPLRLRFTESLSVSSE